MSSTLRALQSRCKSPGHRNQGYLRKTVRDALTAGNSAGGALACWRERFSWEQAASHHGHTPEFARINCAGAGEGNRTLVCSLGSCRSTIELRPPTASHYHAGG